MLNFIFLFNLFNIMNMLGKRGLNINALWAQMDYWTGPVDTGSGIQRLGLDGLFVLLSM